LLSPDKIIGATAATVADALRAEADGADYIGSGAVYPTTTKAGKQLLPLAVLAQIKQSVHLPVVAIGGITAENLLTLKTTGVDGIAVVSAIMNNADPEAATQRIVSLWRR
jgi:thiamine-phosphate pyrophosphorylase